MQGNNPRVLIFNKKIKLVKKNVDICLFRDSFQHDLEKKFTIDEEKDILMFGELKGGIDPAGADEHWKTANSALQRIREKFGKTVHTSFIGSAIERSMAEEIFNQYRDNKISFVANLTKDDQLFAYNEWILSL